MNTITLMGSVALLADRPEVALLRGDVGTVSELVEKSEHHPGELRGRVPGRSGQRVYVAECDR